MQTRSGVVTANKLLAYFKDQEKKGEWSDGDSEDIETPASDSEGASPSAAGKKRKKPSKNTTQAVVIDSQSDNEEVTGTADDEASQVPNA